jgi:3-oxoacyl-[acyl-carrier-protein] synthase II
MADTIELGAVERLMGDHAGKLMMSSTKSMTGHLLGAAGAIEAIFAILRDQVAPPTRSGGSDQPLRQCAADDQPRRDIMGRV